MAKKKETRGRPAKPHRILNARIEKKLFEGFRKMAKKKKMTVTAAVEEALDDWLEYWRA